MHLTDLKHVREDKPAVVRKQITDKGATLYSVEPGDVTHYTVLMSNEGIAAAWVGRPDDIESAVAASRTCVLFVNDSRDGAVELARPAKATVYTQELLWYFCELALGLDMEEPEGLAMRRVRADG